MPATKIVDTNITDPEHSEWVKQAVKEIRTSMKVALKHYKNTYHTGSNIYDMGRARFLEGRVAKKPRTEEIDLEIRAASKKPPTEESDLVQEIRDTVSAEIKASQRSSPSAMIGSTRNPLMPGSRMHTMMPPCMWSPAMTGMHTMMPGMPMMRGNPMMPPGMPMMPPAIWSPVISEKVELSKVNKDIEGEARNYCTEARHQEVPGAFQLWHERSF